MADELSDVGLVKKVKIDSPRQPGFISGKFHASLKAESRYNFITIAIIAPTLFDVLFEY
ncbi:MAG: hypothetical protein R3B37_07395 [Nitrospira sp.]|nr:hypothetical protein [Nitrospira sp.]